MNMLTGCPSRNATTVGMLWERTAWSNALPTCWASTSIFARVNAPSRSVATFSSIGPRVRHGPAPCRPEVDDDGGRLRPLDHDLLEGLVGHLDHVRHGIHATGSRAFPKRRRRSAFSTTVTLEIAIAAAAHIGLSTPTTASGIITTL